MEQRDTPLVEQLVAGGLTQRQAACFERWVADKMPAGITPERLAGAIVKAWEKSAGTLNAQLRDMSNELRLLEMRDLWANNAQAAGK